MNNYECAFCGQKIDTKTEKVTSLLVTVNWEDDNNQEDQQLFCHLGCLKKAMHSPKNLYIDDENDPTL